MIELTSIQKPQINIDHIDPINHDLVCGLKVKTNEIEIDPSYNLKKNNRFVPYRVHTYSEPKLFGDICEFLIDGEWMVTEFGGDVWMEESRRLGFSSTKSAQKMNAHQNTKKVRIKNGYNMSQHPNTAAARKLNSATAAKRMNSHPNTVAVRSTNGKLQAARNRKPVRCMETGVVYQSGKDAAKQNNLSPGNISSCCRGILNTTGGYHWEFIGEN